MPLLLLLCLAAGCSTTVIAPANPVHPQTVLIADYGHHASLLLPDPQGGWIEYAFGDYDWFALGHNSLVDLVHAMVSARKSTLTRRWLFETPDAKALNASKLHPLTVEADRVSELRDHLAYRFEIFTADDMIYSKNADAFAVPCDQQYNMLHNCNHEVGEWIRELGAKTEGSCILSDFRVAK